MKTVYFIRQDHRLAIADVIPSKDTWQLDPEEIDDEMMSGHFHITRINVPLVLRKHRLGSQLLQEICDDADREQVVLTLEPLSTGGLEQDALESWYLRYGFVHTGRLMRREPKKKEE